MRVALLMCLTIGVAAPGETRLGQPLTLTKQTPLPTILKQPDKYVDQTVQVKGVVREVCQKMGCWMELVDSATGQAIRIKVKDGEIVFPKEAVGRTAIAEGKLVRLVLTREQMIARAKHEAEENNRSFDPSSIKSGGTIYQIQGTGAVILE